MICGLSCLELSCFRSSHASVLVVWQVCHKWRACICIWTCVPRMSARALGSHCNPSKTCALPGRAAALTKEAFSASALLSRPPHSGWMALPRTHFATLLSTDVLDSPVHALVIQAAADGTGLRGSCVYGIHRRFKA